MTDLMSLGGQNVTVAVRPATNADVAVISAIQSESMVDTVVSVAGEDLRSTVAERLDPKLIAPTWEETVGAPKKSGNGVLVAYGPDGVCGFAAFATPDIPQEEQATSIAPNLPFEVSPASTQILALDVARDARKVGHGSRLLAAIADIAADQGSPGLLVWIIGEDEGRVKFFQEAGFRPVGVRRNLDAGAAELVEHLWFASL